MTGRHSNLDWSNTKLAVKHIAVVRYLRPVSDATDIADIDDVFDQIQAIIDTVSQCYLFYETRTFKKKSDGLST